MSDLDDLEQIGLALTPDHLVNDKRGISPAARASQRRRMESGRRWFNTGFRSNRKEPAITLPSLKILEGASE